jgi:integrase
MGDRCPQPGSTNFIGASVPLPICVATSVRDLRYSYAAIQLYEHHAPIQYISEPLGHASITITIDTYGHPRQGTSIALAGRLDTPAPETRPYATGT